MSADARNLGGEPPPANQVRALAERVRGLEAELARSSEDERRLRRIVESTDEGVWTIDESGITTFVNRALCAMVARSAEQMVGRHFREFISESSWVEAEERIERLRSGASELHEFPLRHADGHEVWTVMTASRMEDEQGRFVGAMAMVRDATEHRREERMRAELSERVVESQRVESLGVLAGGIAHDFNNLLAAVMGHVEIAIQEPGLALKTRTALANALAAAQRAAGLTRQLLDYSGRAPLHLRALPLGAHTAEMVELLRASIPKRVALEFSSSDPNLAIMADPDRLQQATMNLVINAAEAYGESAGVVLVTVGLATIDEAGLPGVRSHDRVLPGEYVYLEVRDQGAGMDEATIKRVFEPFFTTKSRGRGLGLAATLGIVRTHKGHLTVESRSGQGTTFRAYFPRTHVAPSRDTPLPQKPVERSTRTRTLLVVDDEPMVREFAQRLLEAEGYRVWEAATGRHALDLLSSRLAEIDAVLLDLSMPGMDGDALLSELRAFAPELPVIVHSGHSLESTSERLARWKIAGVLQKPYRAARLSQMVRGLFGEGSSG